MRNNAPQKLIFRRSGLGLLLAAIVAFHERSARAEEIETINITANGPDRTFPGKPFYLAGKVSENVERVQAFIVRGAQPSLFGGGALDCGNLGRALDKEIETDKLNHTERDAAFSSLIGLSVWPSAPWERGEKKGETDFKMLVSPRDDFFRPGASYCVFIYRREQTVFKETKPVESALERLANDADRCSRTGNKGCDAAALGAFERELKHASENFDQASKNSVDKNIGPASPSMFGLIRSRRLVTEILDGLAPETHSTRIRLPAKIPLDDKDADSMSAPDRALGQGVTRALLATSTGLSRGLKVEVGSVPRRTIPVEVVLFKDNLENIFVAHNDDEVRLSKQSKDIPVGDVTLLDILELQRGHFRVLGKYYSGAELNKKLSISFTPDPGQSEFLADAVVRSRALASFVEQALAESSQKPLTEEKPQVGHDGIARGEEVAPRPVASSAHARLKDPLAPLGVWLRDTVACTGALGEGAALTCCDNLASEHEKDDERACRSSVERWAAHRKQLPRSSVPIPLRELAIQLEVYQTKLADWAKVRSGLVGERTIHTVSSATKPFGARFSYSQTAWVFSYVTPTVGYAVVSPSNDSSFPLGYVAAQIHAVPNPVNEPLWTNGRRDLLRLFAVELGASLPASKYGPGDRFRGWKGLPPAFVGITCHLIPYAGVTVGGVLMERRRSPLESEAASATFAPFIGLNIQANIPDAIRGSGKSSATKAL